MKTLVAVLLCLLTISVQQVAAVSITPSGNDYILSGNHLTLYFDKTKGIIYKIVCDGTTFTGDCGFYVRDFTNNLELNAGPAPYQSNAESLTTGSDTNSAWVNFSLYWWGTGNLRVGGKIILGDDYMFKVESQMEALNTTSIRKLKTGFIMSDFGQTLDVFHPCKVRAGIDGSTIGSMYSYYMKPATQSIWEQEDKERHI